MPRTKKSRGSDELVPTEVPQGRVDTDIILSCSESELEAYIKREKNCFFRTNPWNANVERIWLYIKDPIKSITHVAYVGPLKKKGELGPIGQCNKAFNAGSLNKGRSVYRAAYEIRGISRLAESMDYSYLLANGYTRAVGHSNVYTDVDMAKELSGIKAEKIF
ncbi:hypothetical protein H072_6876 [Dactylellina haptotyla CBS 200.50]|uniref:Uncharacterized protein n=1 Tax=Dactylellina haptotyla (strain CBS 200.50) TaxID=1284197 RepID=S8BJA7_DACHA|nr:hypothetical protein H072_6876 [Dactylellina haptotyla CBS 200.50]